MTPSEALLFAWRIRNPNPRCLAHTQDLIPTGFWPEVAEIAMRLFVEQPTLEQVEDEILTARKNWNGNFIDDGSCDKIYLEQKQSKKLKGIDLSNLRINI